MLSRVEPGIAPSGPRGLWLHPYPTGVPVCLSPGAKPTYTVSPVLARGMGMEEWGWRGEGQLPHPHPRPATKCDGGGRTGGTGGGCVTLLALVPERGHSPKPRAHSGAEDSEVKLAMPWELVTRGVPGPLPTPATLLHPLGKNNLVGPTQEPTCYPGGEQREGELGGAQSPPVHYGDIPWHGRGTGQQS